MISDIPAGAVRHGRLMRLSTLIRLRWLAIAGQSAAVALVAGPLGFPLPVMACVTLVAASVLLNIVLAVRLAPTMRLQPGAACCLLAFDLGQLGGLLYLTGGLENPFAVLLIVPVVIAAGALPLRYTVVLTLLAGLVVAGLAVDHRPLPWYAGITPEIPTVLVIGIAVAILSTMLFAALYSWRVAREAWELADALSATELVLQREQHLNALDGLAAAAAHELGSPLATIALVAKEMDKAVAEGDPLKDDVRLIGSQAARCRDILARLTSLSTEGEHLTELRLTALLDEAAAPHRDFGIAITIVVQKGSGAEPVAERKPGVLYGLGNLIENAVDFARSRVEVACWWDEAEVGITVTDDGPGYPPALEGRLGEPYATTRSGDGKAGGLGLGLFIAKTLLERSGATLAFANARERRLGASATVLWPRDAFAARSANRGLELRKIDPDKAS